MAADNTNPTAASSTASSSNGHLYDTVLDTSNDWTYQGYGVLLGGNYKSYREALISHMTALIKSGDGGTSAEELIQKAEQNPDPDNNGTNGSQVRGNPYLYRSVSVADASVGGNDAINPYSAFGLDDDIVHDVSWSSKDGNTWGMGRCYAEMYESKQQILYLTMGIPKFRNLQTWLENATDKELAEMNDIGTISLATKIGRLITSGVSLAIQLPWLPIKWAANIVTGVKDFKVTEYFYFRDNMPLYYRYVNSILSEIAVGMGIYGNGPDDAVGDTDQSNKGKPANGSNINSTQLAKYMVNMPKIMEDGPDIFKIMCRRSRRMGGDVKTTSDDLFEQMEQKYRQANEKDKSTTIWNSFKSGLRNFWTGIETGALEGMNFIGFRIEKCDVANESFSNSTDNSPLLNTLNNEVAQKREQNLGALAQGTGAAAGVLRLYNQGKNLAKNVNEIITGKKGAEATIAYLASGNGFFDLPKQWSGSSGMTRNVSFNFKLRARTGGDNVSIFQSIMIPLSCLLAAALPRGVGDSTYTSPFLVRAFCKGMFAIPAGIINTLSITRGSAEFGWSLSKLPTVVDVSFTIEDLSPMLFLSIAGQGELTAVTQAFGNNTKMHEYINTLVGIGAKERYYILGQLKRRFQTALLISKNTIFSATYRGYAIGDSSIIRSIMALTPFTRVKNN